MLVGSNAFSNSCRSLNGMSLLSCTFVFANLILILPKALRFSLFLSPFRDLFSLIASFTQLPYCSMCSKVSADVPLHTHCWQISYSYTGHPTWISSSLYTWVDSVLDLGPAQVTSGLFHSFQIAIWPTWRITFFVRRTSTSRKWLTRASVRRLSGPISTQVTEKRRRLQLGCPVYKAFIV